MTCQILRLQYRHMSKRDWERSLNHLQIHDDVSLHILVCHPLKDVDRSLEGRRYVRSIINVLSASILNYLTSRSVCWHSTCTERRLTREPMQKRNKALSAINLSCQCDALTMFAGQ